MAHNGTADGKTLAYFQPYPGHFGTEAAPRDEGLTLVTIGEAAASLFFLLILSGMWAAPVTGYAMTTENSAILRNAFFPAYGAVLALCALRFWDYGVAMAREWVLLLLILFSALSMFWSIDADGTMRRSIALFFTIFGGVVLATRWRFQTLTELIALSFAISGVLSLLLAVGYPAWGKMHELFPGAWRGVFLEKNALGGMMSLGMAIQLAAAFYAPRRRWLWVSMALLSIGLVVMSQSKTSLVSVVLCIGVLAGCWLMRRGPAMAIVAAWLGITGVMGIAGLYLTAPDWIFDQLGKDATLTGRTNIWEAAWRQYLTVPWQGFGYGVLWDHPTGRNPAAWIAHDAGFVAGHAHNGWLEVLLGLGASGLALTVLYMLQFLRRMVVIMFTSDLSYLVAPIFALFMLRSITEVSLLDYHDVLWTIFVACGTAMMLELDRRREAQP